MNKSKVVGDLTWPWASPPTLWLSPCLHVQVFIHLAGTPLVF